MLVYFVVVVFVVELVLIDKEFRVTVMEHPLFVANKILGPMHGNQNYANGLSCDC